jgi:hypothetical protein
LDVSAGIEIGDTAHYQGGVLDQNYSDVTAVIYTRAWDTSGGGPLTNGGLIIACGEDGVYGTINACDNYAAANNTGDVVWKLSTSTPYGDPIMTFDTGGGTEIGRFQDDGWNLVSQTGDCANAASNQLKICNDDDALSVYDDTGNLGEVVLVDDVVRGTGVTTHGVMMWGDSSDSFDLGSEVCAGIGLSCQTTHQMDGTNQTCSYDHGTATTYFMAHCY